MGELTNSDNRDDGSQVDYIAGTVETALLKDVGIMGEQLSAGDIMGYPAVSVSAPAYSDVGPRQRFWMFRVGLYLFDFLAVYGSFGFALWVAGMPFNVNFQGMSFLMPVLFSCLLLPFFPSGDLYSYHLIFSKKRHFPALFRALGWGCLAITLAVSQYLVPSLLQTYPLGALLIGCICLGLFIWFGTKFKDFMHNLLRAAGVSLVAVALIHLIHDGEVALLPNIFKFILVGMVLAVAALTIGRYTIIEKIYNGWLMRHVRRQVGIVGTNKEAENITAHVIEKNAPFWISGTIGCDGRLNAPFPKDCLGDIIEIPIIAERNCLNDIIITDENLDKRTLISLLDFAISKGITVWFPPGVLPIIDEKIYIDNFCGIPMIRMCQQKRVVFYNRFKYALDALAALPLLLVLSPLFFLIAAAIKINSRGPVFYRADAVGKNGQPFKMFKFRSMRVNNDNEMHKKFVTKLIKGEMDKTSDKSQPLKITDDPRVTIVGKILRKYSLDELPQLFNVVMGQMSLIGPRPCLPYEFEVYQDWYKKRASIRPGITGLWQVTGRSEVAFEEMVLLDLYYVYNRNVWLDMNILIDTVYVVLKKEGAY